MTTHYDTLGVDQDASDKDIKAAYKKLVLSLHPDKRKDDGGGDSDGAFIKVSEAYGVLSDSQKRRMYDAQLKSGIPFASPGANQNRRTPFNFFTSRTMDPIRVPVTITLGDVAKGVVKCVNYKRIEFCGTCNGRGYETDADAAVCTACNGIGQCERTIQMGFFRNVFREMCCKCNATGKMVVNACKTCNGDLACKTSASVKIRIPPGIANNDSVVFKSKGNQIAHGMYTDLVIAIRVEKHAVFDRVNDTDLAATLSISLAEALVGFDRTLTHPDGTSIPITVSSGVITTPDTVTVVPGKGAASGQGSLHVRYRIEFPPDLGTFLGEIHAKNMSSIDSMLEDEPRSPC